MRVLVTGGAGAIGVNLCKRMLTEGNEVICLDNFYSSDRSKVNELEGHGFLVIDHDVVEGLDVVDGKIDQIYHLACPASPPKYQKDHIYTLDVNYLGTKRVLEFAEKQGARMLFTSTSEVYGDPLESPQYEDYRGNVNPHGIRSCYDEGKRVAESLCMNFCRERGVDVRIVRIFNTYGPGMDKDDGRAISNFILQALKGSDITVYGDGTQTRSFQYMDDLVDGLTLYMNLGEKFPGPINLGNPEEISVLELAGKIIELTGSDSKIVFSELPADDPLQRRPDISLAKDKLGWKPRVGLEEGLKKTIEYFRKVV